VRTRLFTLCGLAGVPLRIDATWPLAVAVFVGVTYGLFPGAPWMSAVAVVILYSSLLAHEMAHVVVGQRMGLGVREVVLSMTGATAYFEGDENHGEAWLAAAGPALSVVLAVLFGAITIVAMQVRMTNDLVHDPLCGGLALGAILNAGIAAFNLLPIYPLDGGRILHAALLKITRNRIEAIGISSALTIGACLMVIGWGEWTVFAQHQASGLFRVVVAVMLGGQALGAYRAEVRKSRV
jgi:Zn-dependent protease